MKGELALTAAARGLTIVIGVVAAVITARALGVEGRGDYFYVTTVAIIAVQLSNLGLASSNAYFASLDRLAVGSLLTNSLVISATVAPAVVGVVVLLLYAANAISVSLDKLFWATVIAPCTLFYLLASNLLVGLQDFRKYNAVVICVALLQLTLLSLAATTSPTVNAFLSVSAICSFTSSLAAAWLVTKKLPPGVSRQVSIPLLTKGMGYALRAFVILVCGYLLSRMPVIVAGLNGDTRSVGLLSVVVQFLDVILILPASVAMILFPELVRTERDRRGSRILRVGVWVLFSMVLLCSLLGFVAFPLVVFLFGDAFAPSADALQWALPGVALLGTASVVSQYLAAVGFPMTTVLAWAFAMAIGYALAPTELTADAPRDLAFALSVAYGVLALLIAASFVAELLRTRYVVSR